MLKQPDLVAVQVREVITIQDSPQPEKAAGDDEDDDDDFEIEIDIVGLSPPPSAPSENSPAVQQALKGGPPFLPEIALTAGNDKGFS